MRIRSHLRHASCARAYAHLRTPTRTYAHAKQNLCHAALQHQSLRVNPMPPKRTRTAYKPFSPLALCHPFKKILMRPCAFSGVNPNRLGTGFAYAPSLRQRVRLRIHAYTRTYAHAPRSIAFAYRPDRKIQ